MKLHACWFSALLVAFACSTKSVDDDDDDSSSGESGENSSGGSSGKAGRGGGGKAAGGTQGGTDSTGGTGTGGTAAGGSSGETGGADATGGTGGSSAASGSSQGATGGDMGQGGEGQAGDASPGSGGSDVTGGTGGTSGDGGTGGTGGGSDEPPLVQLLVDGSSSMFENGMWEQLYASLVTDGVVDAFAGKLNLGLSVFQGSTTPSTEMSAACATMTSTDFAADSAVVASTLSALGENYMVGDKYETPTGFAVNYAAMVLAATSVPAGVRKYLVLVTDGAPNTCAVLDPQCGEDVSIKAVQDARTNGIRTLAVGLDPILAVSSGCPESARCGADHIQDLANAGAAQPIEPPNIVAFIHEPCNNGATLLASYAAVGGGGDATYYFNTNEGGLTGELTKALQAIADDTVP